jgi:hypothetical protein
LTNGDFDQETDEVRIARIDERTELMMKKLDDHCNTLSDIRDDVSKLKANNLPSRVSALEERVTYIFGGLAVITFFLLWLGHDVLFPP